MNFFNTAIKTLLSGLILFSAFSCQKRAETDSNSHSLPPWAIEYPQLEIQWQTAINSGDQPTSWDFPPIYHQGYVICKSVSNIDGQLAPLLFINTATQEVFDTWNDFIEEDPFNETFTSQKAGDYLVLKSNEAINVINLNTRKTQWQSNLPKSFNRVQCFNNYVYCEVQLSESRTAIWRSPLDLQRWELVYEQEGVNGEEPTFFGFGFGTLNNGDEILVWKTKDRQDYHSHTDIYAYNISGDSLLWKRTDFPYDSRPEPLQIKDDRVFGLFQKRAFSLDLADGQTDWIQNTTDIARNNLLNSFENSQFYLNPGSMLITGTGAGIIKLSQATGTLQSFGRLLEEDMTQFPNPLQIQDGLLYLTSANDLFRIDEFDAKLHSRYESPTRFSNKIAFHPNGELLYFHDGHYLYCARIPPL